jgi:hypothetical protein
LFSRKSATATVNLVVFNRHHFILGSTCPMIEGSRCTHSDMYASELEIFIVIVDIYFLTYTYILSSLNGRKCSSGG